MTVTTPDPISNNVERVLVRQTATGFELAIAAGVGFFTAGPLGSAMAYGALKGLQGKWTPWTLLGFIGAPVAVGIQVVTLGVVGAVLAPEAPETLPEGAKAEQVVYSTTAAPVAPTY